MTIKELRDKYAQLVEQARSYLSDAEKRDGGVTADDTAKFDRMINDAENIRKQVEAQEKLESAERDLESRASEQAIAAMPVGATPRTDDSTPEQRDTEQRDQWGAFCSRGETRALEAGSDTAGGFLGAPQVVVREILRNIEDRNFLRQISRVFPLQAAESLGVPTLTPPSDAEWTSELSTGSDDTTMAFGKRELRPHPLAKRIKVSNKLLRQATIDPVALVNEEFGLTFASTEENAFLTGTGTMSPLGVFTASADGISTSRDVSTDNTTTAITSDGLMEAKYALKGQYWGGAQWVFHRTAVKNIAKLKDGEGRYLFDAPTNSLMGFPLNVSENAPSTFTTGLYVGILGDFRYYWIADSMNFDMQRLNELYAATNQTGFIGRRETDGAPVLEEAFVRVTLA